ncbi:MAG TPA: carboxymuconolactone decarboxylase family protein [Dehalococcoidia bacterium]|nr:carboxymuconolactone decarboxylase family protein [Dehalococcoidia bacterium]
MARLPDIRREDLDAQGQAAYDQIAGSRGSVRGPFALLLHHPALAERVAAVGEQLRFRSVLPGADRELAILAAGREVEALFEWAAHEPLGLQEGTRPEAIEVLRNHGSTADLTPREALIIDTVRALYGDHRISDDLYARLEREFGRQALVELIVLAGYYGMIGHVLNAFEAELPAGVTPAFKR